MNVRGLVIILALAVPPVVEAGNLERDAQSPDPEKRRPALEALVEAGDIDVVETALLELAEKRVKVLTKFMNRHRGKFTEIVQAKKREIRKPLLEAVKSRAYLDGDPGEKRRVAARVESLRKVSSRPYTLVREATPELQKRHEVLAAVFDDAQNLLGEGKRLPKAFLELKKSFVADVRYFLEPPRRRRDIDAEIRNANARFEAEGWEKFERTVMEAVNEHRRLLGLARLRVDSALVAVAEAHSKDMKNRNYFGHRAPDPGAPSPKQRCVAAGVTPYVAENIAHEADPEVVVEGWIASPIHHRNLLDPRARRVGIGHVGGRWTLDLAGG